MSSFNFPSSGQGFQTEAVVKWFNLTKGFGFVAPANGADDAFMHSSVVSRAGMRDVAEGTKLLVEITKGDKGYQVANIIQVLGMGDVPPAPARAEPTGPEEDMVGTVKWFKPDKGFGFIAPEGSDRDVFVHRSVVLRAGLQQLEAGQKVNMRVQSAAKGYEATWIQVTG